MTPILFHTHERVQVLIKIEHVKFIPGPRIELRSKKFVSIITEFCDTSSDFAFWKAKRFGRTDWDWQLIIKGIKPNGTEISTSTQANSLPSAPTEILGPIWMLVAAMSVAVLLLIGLVVLICICCREDGSHEYNMNAALEEGANPGPIDDLQI